MSEGAATLHALVLAAGASRRFGSIKPLARYGGQPMLQLAVSRASEAVGAVWVVLGAHAAELAPLLRHSGATVLINRHWQEGLASSIRAGIARLPASCGGVLLALADQPRVTAEDFRRLAAAWLRQPESIVAARHGSVTGAPAILPRCLFSDLGQLRGDTGARRLIERYASRTVCVPMPSASFDVDTPEDLAALSALAAADERQAPGP